MMFLIRALQIILHLPMFRFLIPSNFSMITEIISPIIMFDVLDNNKDWDVTLLMSFDEQALNGEEVLDQMENIGYPTSNCIINLKTLFFLLQIYFLQVLMTILLATYTKITGKETKLFSKLKNQLFFAEILVIGIEGFMELYISGYL